MQIEITGKTEELIQRLIDAGRYDSAEEAVAALLDDQRPLPDDVIVKDTGQEETGDRETRLRRMQDLRQEYLAEGGTLLTVEEVNREVAERRGERYTEE